MRTKIHRTAVISNQSKLIRAAAFALLLPLAALAAQGPVNLGIAANFAILTKSGISTVPPSMVTGNLGVSPIDSTAITGFSLILDGSDQFATSSQVIGSVYGPDYASPTPVNLTTAVGDMQTAYTDAAGRTLPDYTELGSGSIGGMTLAPGLYKWSSAVTIATDITLSGGPNAIWIFQVAGDLTLANGAAVNLSGGAQAGNIFWQVAGGTGVDLGTTSQFQGTLLTEAGINVRTGASVKGRLLAQTAVTLDADAITLPILQAPPSFRSIQRASDGTVTMLITNTPGLALTLQTSTDLVSWETLETVTPTNSLYSITDTSAVGEATRFYRAFNP